MTPAQVLAVVFPEGDGGHQTIAGYGCQEHECECRGWSVYQRRSEHQARILRLARVVSRREIP